MDLHCTKTSVENLRASCASSPLSQLSYSCPEKRVSDCQEGTFPISAEEPKEAADPRASQALTVASTPVLLADITRRFPHSACCAPVSPESQTRVSSCLLEDSPQIYPTPSWSYLIPKSGSPPPVHVVASARDPGLALGSYSSHLFSREATPISLSQTPHPPTSLYSKCLGNKHRASWPWAGFQN